jgi:hypothetical protein
MIEVAVPHLRECELTLEPAEPRGEHDAATGISGTVQAVTKGNLLRRYRQQVTGTPSLEAMV